LSIGERIVGVEDVQDGRICNQIPEVLGRHLGNLRSCSRDFFSLIVEKEEHLVLDNGTAD